MNPALDLFAGEDQILTSLHIPERKHWSKKLHQNEVKDLDLWSRRKLHILFVAKIA